MVRIALLISLTFSALPLTAQTSIKELVTPPATAESWTITSVGAPHGKVAHWQTADGTRWSRMSQNLRGFITEIDQRIRLSPDGELQSLVVRGTIAESDAAESYVAGERDFSFQSPVDHGSGTKEPHSFYVPFGGTPGALSVLAESLMKAPDHSLALLPWA